MPLIGLAAHFAYLLLQARSRTKLEKYELVVLLLYSECDFQGIPPSCDSPRDQRYVLPHLLDAKPPIVNIVPSETTHRQDTEIESQSNLMKIDDQTAAV
jgi:hypothetical protein